MKNVLSILFLSSVLSASGQSIELVIQKPVEVEELKKVYQHYVQSDFATIAKELAKRAAENPINETIISAHVSSPTEQYELRHRSLARTLSAAWQFHTGDILKDHRREKFEVLMSVLEDKEVGVGRIWAIWPLSQCLASAATPHGFDRDFPATEDTIRRMSAIALDDREPFDLRKEILPLLFQHGDPNDYLDLAIKISSLEKSPLSVVETFQKSTTLRNPNNLTKENRAKYFRHAFQLLETIDDKKTGTGYFFAICIGTMAGVPPVQSGQGPFAPPIDILQQYQNAQDQRSHFFQKTVDNAWEWWEQNKSKYPSE